MDTLMLRDLLLVCAASGGLFYFADRLLMPQATQIARAVITIGLVLFFVQRIGLLR